MTRKEALAELIAKVEAGRAQEYNGPMWHTIFGGYSAVTKITEAYHSSIHAALALHLEVLPEWGWGCQDCGTPFAFVVNGDVVHEAKADTPARAWLLAILKALHEMEENKLPDTSPV